MKIVSIQQPPLAGPGASGAAAPANGTTAPSPPGAGQKKGPTGSGTGAANGQGQPGRQQASAGRAANGGTAPPAGSAANDQQPDSGDQADQQLPAAAMRVDDLPSARGGVTSVPPSAQINEVTTLMWQHQFSQIPVLEGDSYLHGVVTWESLFRLYQSSKERTVANAMERSCAEIRDHDNLLAVLPKIAMDDYAIVRNRQLKVVGIVTTADVATRFGVVAEPFFVIGEIERRLRAFLAPVFDGTPMLKKSCGKNKESVSQLMFGEYVKLLSDEDNWQKLGWDHINRALFVKIVDEVRNVRNAVAHFRARPLTPAESQRVHELLAMLKKINL
ncbi:CBS domain-containing protein [Pseudofrankia sp. BMG5.36]|uniref:CBS domain-containing protein n=1 Tax=Pseudofrankia sp. BMG5.36 TaxID=1834512 RepID=UPI001041E925|nr:CBS domain-containing protein [Pseudofrankia sp. BMG5.36]